MLSKKGAPLYFQVENYIREKILNGEWAIGTQIPTEIQLMEMFRVSRQTLRHAISDLVNEGLLERLQGQGTFVRNTSPYESDPTRIEITALAGHAHRMISVEEKPSTEELCRLLNVDEDERFTVISYLHYSMSRNVVLNLSISYMPISRFPDVAQHYFKDSVYAIAQKIYGIHVHYANSTLRAVELDEQLACYLEAAAGTPVIKIQKVFHDNVDEPVFLTEMYLHPYNSSVQIKTQL
ncbi:MAG: GntR family transcriptional regulator [Lachnospiraceae bacterium]|nr:GntR family transcriptional regulator [Lachnospiraceae bacterium]